MRKVKGLSFSKQLERHLQVPHTDLHIADRKPKYEGISLSFMTLSGLEQHVRDRSALLGQVEDSEVQYQLLVSLFDVTYKQFYGRQWKGPIVAAKGTKVQYNKSVFFHTCINNPNILAVFEVVAHEVDQNGHSQAVSCGWTFVRLFSTEGDMPDSSRGVQPQTQRLSLYHGTPRALFFMEDPIENNTFLKTMEASQLSCSVQQQKSLLGIMHLLPQNTLVDSKDIIPGLIDVPNSDKFKTPTLANQISIVVDGLHIRLHPNVEKFETELCELLQEDKLQKEATQITIMERRLHVGVHNGWCYIDKPSVFHLEKSTGLGNDNRKPSQSPTARRSSHFQVRRNSAGSSSLGSTGNSFLVLKNKIEIHELIEDPSCAVVFTIEYVIGEPLSAQDRKQTHSLTRAFTRSVNVRWAAWTPLQQSNSQDVTLALVGGPVRSPDDAFVYKVPATSMQDEITAVASGGLLAFRWAKDGETISPGPLTLAVPNYPAIGSSLSLRTEASDMMYESHGSGDLHRKPPAWKHSQHRASILSTRNQGYMIPPSSGGAVNLPSATLLQPNVATPMAAPTSALNAAPGSVYVLPQYTYQAPPITAAQQQMMSMANAYPYMYTPPNGLQPIDIMHRQETSASTELRDLPFTPVHALVLAQTPQPKGGRGLSRAAYARLYAAGFPPLLDRNGEAPEVIDPHGQYIVNLSKELMDPLQANEIIFQFLAYTREPLTDHSTADSSVQPATVYFTFQFYRFPQVTTERMLLSKAQNDLSSHPSAVPFVLQRLNPNGSIMEGPPGLEVKYPIDPTYLKPGEVSLFWQHLSRQTMHIDIWDGDSLLLIGSAAVELKYLFRGGNEAVQTTFELDVLATEYQEDSGALTGEMVRGGSIRPVGVNCLNRGRLHFRMANIGYNVDKKKTELLAVPSKTQVVVSQTAGNSAYKGGSLTTVIPSAGTKKVRVAKAKHLSENREVASLLFSEQKRLDGTTINEDDEIMAREGDAERLRKLARLQAVKNKTAKEESNNGITTIIGYRQEKTERARDYKTMDIYRNQTKHDGIISMLSTSITTEHILFPSFGTTEFFEFVLRNPFNNEQTLTIEINDPDLFLVTDAREWRHYKQLFQLTTPIEENMFTSASSDQSKPQIFLRPKEQVYIPLKFLTLKADMSIQAQGPSNPFNKTTRQTEMEKSLESRMTKVTFRSEEGKAVAILIVRIEPQPHVVDQTFRFHHPENSFLKKSIRLPPYQTLPGVPIGGVGINQVYVRCSDPNVIIDCKPTQPGEPHDIFLKVAVGASPQIKRFFLCAYIDPFLSRPAQIWQCYVHALQRVDVTCVEGQTSRIALLLKGTQASRVVKCFTSHPQELVVSPQDPFILAAGTVHELAIGVRPMRTGSKFFYVNVVDIEYHQLVRSWLVCANCRSPIVSRAFELVLPVGGGKNSSKRITYTNPYPVMKRFRLLCDRNDLLQFKESLLEIEGGGTHPIGLKFLPVMQPGAAEIMVFINDEEDKNEETFRVSVTYKFM
ncbi:nephrocystin-4 isoform X1 [Biomphalaria glabrata]|nr:nephrocystin-4 isoform X1 [Biomphalaria glabrata]